MSDTPKEPSMEEVLKITPAHMADRAAELRAHLREMGEVVPGVQADPDDELQRRVIESLVRAIDLNRIAREDADG